MSRGSTRIKQMGTILLFAIGVGMAATLGFQLVRKAVRTLRRKQKVADDAHEKDHEKDMEWLRNLLDGINK